MSLGNNIKKYRRDLGMTQEELAGILCITSQAVSKWESGAGMPDVTQIVPLAKALNVSTDALFGFSSESYDVKLTEEILHEADALQESCDPAEGALAAAEYLDQKCEEHIFNYRIMTRYVQAIGHLSRFVNQNNSYYEGILSDDKKRWKQMVRSAENRAMQVVRYAEEKELADKCHYALAWVYWHIQEFEKGREHIAALPSIRCNMLQETLLPYYRSVEPEGGFDDWSEQIRDNYQNFVRAINKQIVYAAEGLMWVGTVDAAEANDRWGLSIMETFMENEKMRAHCQGFYRETSKFLVGSYLRHNEPEKAAAEWKRLVEKIEEYLSFCVRVSSEEKAKVVREFGVKAAENMAEYTREYIEAKKKFMLGQLKSWGDEAVFAEFEKRI